MLSAIFGCSGGDDSGPTDPGTACSIPWGGSRSWFVRGGSSAVADLRSPSNPACPCSLVYTVSVPRPL